MLLSTRPSGNAPGCQKTALCMKDYFMFLWDIQHSRDLWFELYFPYGTCWLLAKNIQYWKFDLNTNYCRLEHWIYMEKSLNKQHSSLNADWYICELAKQVYIRTCTVTPKENWIWCIRFGIDLNFFFNVFFVILDSESVNPLKHQLHCLGSLKPQDLNSAFQSLLGNGERALHFDEIQGYLVIRFCEWVSNNLICSTS